jgi:hypothetical protein
MLMTLVSISSFTIIHLSTELLGSTSSTIRDLLHQIFC